MLDQQRRLKLVSGAHICDDMIRDQQNNGMRVLAINVSVDAREDIDTIHHQI